jgi:hypothetical protein
MAVFLPRVAAHVVKAAAKDAHRYAMNGVQILDPGDGTYRLEATDGKRAVILRGYNLDESLVPLIPELHEEESSVGIVPAADWLEGFKMIPKEKGWRRVEFPLGIRLGKTTYTMGTSGAQRQGGLLEGRFPEIERVLPGNEAKFTIAVNPQLLAELLMIAKHMCGEGNQRVLLHFYGPEVPMGMSFQSGEHGGVFVDALLMPLTPAENVPEPVRPRPVPVQGEPLQTEEPPEEMDEEGLEDEEDEPDESSAEQEAA